MIVALNIRIRDDEKAVIRDYATRHGRLTSDWAREVLLREARKQRRPELPQFWPVPIETVVGLP
jgi:plasmid stability protein